MVTRRKSVQIFNTQKSRRCPQKGATSIEYALIASLISTFIVVALRLTGDAVVFTWTTKISAAVQAALGS